VVARPTEGATVPTSPSNQGFAITTTSDETAHVVRVEGELDVSSRDRLAAVLDGLTRPPMIVVLDVAALSFVDSAGLKTILHEHHRARDERYEFVVAGATGPVRETFRITAFDLTLPLVDDVQAVLGD
jgi:anti-sigma B factor antagonist